MTNIALIVLDTLRKDAFDRHFDWLPGTRFENAWSTSHWTVPAHASLFTGKYASEVGVYRNAERFDWSEDVLAEKLRNQGYTTRAFSANPNISKQFDFHRGFTHFEGSWRLKALDRNMFDWDAFIAKTRNKGPERYPLALWKCVSGDYNTVPSLKKGILLKLRDLGYGRKTIDDGASSALHLIQQTDFGDDEFLFVNLMEAHSPYQAPDEYRTIASPEISGLEATFGEPRCNPNDIRRAYNDEVRYLSDMYRQMFIKLRNDFDLIITVSDHGELFGEYGAWEHMYGIYPELTHVPLTVYDGGDESTENHSTVSILDIYGTILNAADINTHSESRDLRTEIEDGEFLTEYHGISDRHYHSLKNDGFEDIDYLDTELTGLVNGGYYGHETFDGFNEYGDCPYEDPVSYLRELIENLEKRTVKEETELDEAVINQLKDLGYA